MLEEYIIHFLADEEKNIGRFLTQEEYKTGTIATLFKVNPHTVSHWIDQGFLEGVWKDGMRIVTKNSLETFIHTYHMEGSFEEIIFSPKEVETICHISQIHRLFRRGLIPGAFELPHKGKNKRLRIPLSAVKKFIETYDLPRHYLTDYLEKNHEDYYRTKYVSAGFLQTFINHFLID